MSRWWGRVAGVTGAVWIVAACALSPVATGHPQRSALHGVEVVGEPNIVMVGEAFLDLGWPSEHREGCLTVRDRAGHAELVSDELWTVRRGGSTGWFEITDEVGTVVAFEHQLVKVRGAFLDRPGCREGRLFRVDEIAPLVPAGGAALRIDVAHPDGPVFIEGSVNVVRVLVDGEPVFQKPVQSGTSIAVPSGPIQVVDFQKPCNGNCQDAYGSELPCSLELDLAPGEVATVSLALTAEGCTSEVRTEGAAAGGHASSPSAGP